MLHSDRATAGRLLDTVTTTLLADLVATTPAMREVPTRLLRFAVTDEPVIILGESGTGKSRLAHWLHRFSRRATGPFHALNLGHLDDALAASELFGHIKGSFTDARERREGAFAAANGGTLFLDEMTKPRLSVQAKLLDFMETRTYKPVGTDRRVVLDVRLIFAANEDPEALVREGRMLPDFVARLGHFRIILPPLRERRAEIPTLLHNSVAAHAPAFGYRGQPAPSIAPALEDALVAHDWPHNLRELDSLVRRLLVDATGALTLGVDLLVGDLERYRGTPAPRRQSRGARVRELADAIRECEGNKAGAARLMGISRATMNREHDVMKQRANDGMDANRDGTEDVKVSHSAE